MVLFQPIKKVLPYWYILAFIKQYTILIFSLAGYRYLTLWKTALLIRINFGRLDADPGGQKLPTKIGKSEETHVLKYWMFSFLNAEGLSWSLDVLFFTEALVHQNPGSGSALTKFWIRIRIEANVDSHHWYSISSGIKFENHPRGAVLYAELDEFIMLFVLLKWHRRFN